MNDARRYLDAQHPRRDRRRAPHGSSFPLGATICQGGVNFSVFSKHATGVQLLFFDRVDAATPTQVVDLDPRTQRSYHYWHAFVPDIAAGQLYAYRVDGPFDPERGHRFDRDKVLLDPYGRCVARPAGWSRAAAREPGDNCASALKSVVADPACLRLGGRPSSAHVLCQDGCVRDARRRLHPASQLRRRGAEARHVPGSDREDSPTCRTSASPPSSCCRCSPSTTRMRREA